MEAGNSKLMEDMVFSKEKAKNIIRKEVEHISFLPMRVNRTPSEHSELINEIQRYLVNNTCLGIPAIIHGECTGGLCTRGATHYHTSVSLDSTWDSDLVQKMTNQIREQMRAIGILQVCSPNLNIESSLLNWKKKVPKQKG